MNRIYMLAKTLMWYTCPGCGEIYNSKYWVTCPECRRRAYKSVLEKKP